MYLSANTQKECGEGQKENQQSCHRSTNASVDEFKVWNPISTQNWRAEPSTKQFWWACSLLYSANNLPGRHAGINVSLLLREMLPLCSSSVINHSPGTPKNPRCCLRCQYKENVIICKLWEVLFIVLSSWGKIISTVSCVTKGINVC